MVNVMVIAKDMQKGCVVKMDEESIEKLELWKKTQNRLIEEVKGTKGRDKEALEERIESCRRLIRQLHDKDNPTKKKEMYK